MHIHIDLLTVFCSDDRICRTFSAIGNNGIGLLAGTAITPLVLNLGWTAASIILGGVPCVLILSALFGITGLAVSQAAADILSVGVALPLLIPLLKKLKALPDGAHANI